MIKILGIIVEYNPFHKGHLYHLEKAKEIVQPDYVIAVMSGNFTQRGEPAIIDKWARTKMALHHGIDLVLELPVLYACQTAELFARGAVNILHQTGLVTHLAFGSEYSDLSNLNKIATILAKEPQEYKILLKDNLGLGLSFPHARANAIKKYILDLQNNNGLSSRIMDNILDGSNSILALEYLKSLYRLKSSIKPVVIPRLGSSYNSKDIEGNFSSATAIRNALLSHKDWQDIAFALPDISLKILKDTFLQGRGPVSLSSFEQILLGLIRRSSNSEIASWMDVEEGLENRIKQYARETSTIEDFLYKTKTKRYTYTRLQRILIHGLLGINKDQVSILQDTSIAPYLRILGFNSKKADVLKRLKSTSHIPIISKPADYFCYKSSNVNIMFETSVLASDIYCLGFPHINERIGGQEFTQGVIII